MRQALGLERWKYVGSACRSAYTSVPVWSALWSLFSQWTAIHSSTPSQIYLFLWHLFWLPLRPQLGTYCLVSWLFLVEEADDCLQIFSISSSLIEIDSLNLAPKVTSQDKNYILQPPLQLIVATWQNSRQLDVKKVKQVTSWEKHWKEGLWSSFPLPPFFWLEQRWTVCTLGSGR